MKTWAIIFLLWANLGFAQNLYQVVSQHPEDLAILLPKVKTIYRENRLWVVALKNPAHAPTLKGLIRPAEGLGLKTYAVPRARPSQPKNPIIVRATQEMSQERITQDVKWLSSYKNRSAGSEETKKVEQILAERMGKLGYRIAPLCLKGRICSILAEKSAPLSTGISGRTKWFVIAAHFDSVGKDFAGADDNATGTAVMLEMARVLAIYPTRQSIRFLFTNGEERGLWGSRDYVQRLEAAGQLDEIAGVINMDMVGYNSNGIVELETDAKFESLARRFAALVSTYTPLQSKITLGAWGSDHVPFLKKGIPAILTIEDWSTKTPCYHAKCDTPDTINYRYALEIGKLNLAAVLAL